MTQVETANKEKPKEHKPRKKITEVNGHFSLTNKYALTFKELLKVFKEAMTDEIALDIHENKLAIRQMDASRVKMADWEIPKQDFEEWDVSNPRAMPARITLAIDTILDIISDITKESKVTLEFKVKTAFYKMRVRETIRNPSACPKCNTMTLTQNNALPPEKAVKNRYKCNHCGWRGKVRKRERWIKKPETETIESKLTIYVTEKVKERYTVETLESNEEEVPIPMLSRDAKVKLVTKAFREKLEKISKFTDHIKMLCDKDKLVLLGEGDIVKDINVTFEKGMDMVLDLESILGVKTTYSLGELLSIVPPNEKLSAIIELSYASDMPLKVSWHTMFGEAKIDFYLAPRIEVE